MSEEKLEKEEAKEKAPKKVKEKAAKPSAKKGKKDTVSDPSLYDVIVRPVVTEKSTNALEYNKVTFKVKTDESKLRIKQAVEELFGVSVVNVNTITNKGKVKRFRGQTGKRSDFKKAIVTLKEGDHIDFETGVK